MPKKLNEKTLPLPFDWRDWQKEAIASCRQKYKTAKNFLCVATPGSGKTLFGLGLAYDLKREGLIDRIVVIAPTERIKEQWAEDAALYFGIDLDPFFKNGHGIETLDFHGISITYSLLAQDKKGVHQQNTFNHKTFVIFDEPHHMGDALTWGNAALKAFDNAVYRLLISGTPFRSDKAKIPFVRYDEDSTSIADYTYTYERSIIDNVCRPVYFTIHDGRMQWKVDKYEFNKTFKDFVEKDQASKRLRTALDTKGNYVRDVMKAADEKLNEIRKSHQNAGGLIFCTTQRHAKEIAKVVEEITRVMPPIVISEDSEGAAKIKSFKRSTGKWLVSVKMVSEGVDIPRLRVGVDFSIVKAELWFRQMVGRFVRYLKDLKEQDAFIFIPADKDKVKLAETIQEERKHALATAKPVQENYTDLFGTEMVPALKGRFEVIGSQAVNSKTIAVAVEVTSPRYGIDHQRIEEDNNPVFVQIEIIKKRLNQHAKHYALLHRNGNVKPDFKMLHKKYLTEIPGARPMDLQTKSELIKREQYYIQQLRNNR